MTVRVLVVEDEAPARRRLVRMLGRIADLEVVGEAGDAESALALVRSAAPDLALVDIRLPGQDGLWLAERLGPVGIIFTTAYDAHAIQAFDLAAVDYVLKPFDQGRLERAIDRAKRLREAGSVQALTRRLRDALGGAGARPRLSARVGSTVHVFDPSDVDRILADAKYSVVRRDGQDFMLERSLGELEQELGPHGFLRVHRSALVNLAHVKALHHTDTGAEIELRTGERVPVSRRALPDVERHLGVRRR